MREGVLLTFVGMIGACVGSFLNVVAYRLPRECMSISKPRSRCPRCATPIAWFDNVPIVSWLLLRGRCRHCSIAISPRYPLVELFVAGLFLLVAWLWLGGSEALRWPFEHGTAWLEWVVAAVIVSALVALSLIDVDYRILPDDITKPGIVLAPLFAFLAPRMQHGRFALDVFGLSEWGVRGNAALNGVLGMVLAAGTLYGIGWLGAKAFGKPAMGFGDVKMIAGMGGLLGLWSLLALAVAAFSGSIVGLAVRAITRGRYIPFGPFLALGTLVVMLRGPELLDAWVGLFRPE